MRAQFVFQEVWTGLRRILTMSIALVVVVAVSGGGDSVGLLRALHGIGAEFDLRLSVAHLDHGTRGEEGQGDARFVAELAGSLLCDALSRKRKVVSTRSRACARVT